MRIVFALTLIILGLTTAACLKRLPTGQLVDCRIVGYHPPLDIVQECTFIKE